MNYLALKFAQAGIDEAIKKAEDYLRGCGELAHCGKLNERSMTYFHQQTGEAVDAIKQLREFRPS